VKPRSTNDEDAFRRFAAGSVAPLGRLAYLLCGDRHFAEDLVQTCLIRMYMAWPRIHHPEKVDAYARRVLLRCWLNETRKPWRRRELRNGDVPDRADPAADPSRTIGSKPVNDVLAQALERVPPRQRAAIILRYWSQLSVTETAKIMRCSEGNVKSQSARGLDALRAALTAQGADIEILKEMTYQ
jgi:RNA polymerase sigma-70 factor (sigma-E family)